MRTSLYIFLLFFCFTGYSQLEYNQELFVGYGPGVYRSNFSSSFNSLGHQIFAGYGKEKNFLFFAQNGCYDCPPSTVSNSPLIDFINFKSSLGYFSSKLDESKYRSLSLPIQVGFGKRQKSNLNNSIEVFVGAEAVYPLSNYSGDPVHLLLSGGILFAHFRAQKTEMGSIRTTPKSSIFLKYSKSAGVSSIHSSIQMGVLLGLGFVRT